MPQQSPERPRRRNTGAVLDQRSRRRSAPPKTGASSTRPERSDVATRLLAWFDEHRRELPWRKSGDPYAVWVSEIMLQQTRVATVLDYYRRWMSRFPTLQSLAKAAEQDVLGAWQGLGYYSRARNLQRGALVVMDRHGGVVPADVAELRALPGVGGYTAGAIASIAYGVPVAAVDGNVVRVLTRIFGLRGDPTRAPLKAELQALAKSLIPEQAAGNFNQALMELGATRCTPTKPACDQCPVATSCRARELGLETTLPELPPRAKPIAEHRVAAVIRRNGRYALSQCPRSATRWQGLWLFPNAETQPGTSTPSTLTRLARDELGLTVDVGQLLFSQKHSITKFRITLDAYDCRATGGRMSQHPDAPRRWFTTEQLAELPLPAPHRRIATQLLQR